MFLCVLFAEGPYVKRCYRKGMWSYMLHIVSTEESLLPKAIDSTEVMLKDEYRRKAFHSFIETSYSLQSSSKWITKTISIQLSTKLIKASIIYYKRLVAMTSTMKKLKVKMEKKRRKNDDDDDEGQENTQEPCLVLGNIPSSSTPFSLSPYPPPLPS